jgi:hypothetical protein
LGSKELCELRFEASGIAFEGTRGAGHGARAHEDTAPQIPSDEAKPIQIGVRREYGVSMEPKKIRQPPAAGKPTTRAKFARSDGGSDLRRQLLSQTDRVSR